MLLSDFEADDPRAVTNTGTWDGEIGEEAVGSVRTIPVHGVRATASFLAGSPIWTRNGLQVRILPNTRAHHRFRWVQSCQALVQFLFQVNPSLTRGWEIRALVLGAPPSS